jgi:hypothetical protein
MEVDHPELKQKLQELEHELEVSRHVSNAMRSVLGPVACVRAFVLRHQ